MNIFQNPKCLKFNLVCRESYPINEESCHYWSLILKTDVAVIFVIGEKNQIETTEKLKTNLIKIEWFFSSIIFFIRRFTQMSDFKRLYDGIVGFKNVDI